MLEEHINTIENSKYELANSWCESEIIYSILSEKLVSPDNFQNKYAIAVIEYFIGVIKKEKQLGDCPVMHKMLNDFANANLSSEEVFIICAQLKRTIIKFTFDNSFASKEIIDQINFMLDENFRGVIRIYDTIIHEHTLELEAQEELFKQYTDAIDASTIVSKADEKGIITYVNKAFEEVSGYSKEKLIGKPIFKCNFTCRNRLLIRCWKIECKWL